MEAIQGLFKEYKNEDFKGEVLGKLVDVFKGYKFSFKDTDVNKSATFTFRDANGKFLNVVLSKPLDAMYRTKQITKLQLIGCEVIKMDLINPDTKELIAKDTLRLRVPERGLMTMEGMKAETYVDAIAGFAV